MVYTVIYMAWSKYESQMRCPVFKIVKILSFRKHFKILQHLKVKSDINCNKNTEEQKCWLVDSSKEFTINRIHYFKYDSLEYLKDI